MARPSSVDEWTVDRIGDRPTYLMRLSNLAQQSVACIAAIHLSAFASAPATAIDGFDEVLRLCPDDKVSCVSSLDPSPSHFLEPWEYDGATSDAVDAVSRAIGRMSGRITARDETSARGTALFATFADDSDAAVFFFPSDDFVVHFRSERTGALWDGSQNKMRLNTMRKSLGMAPVPVVRNRLYRPEERLPNGQFRLQEERPYRRADGRFYGNQGYGEGDDDFTSVGSVEAVRRLLFPFGRLGGRSSAAQALYDDLSDLATMRPEAERER